MGQAVAELVGRFLIAAFSFVYTPLLQQTYTHIMGILIIFDDILEIISKYWGNGVINSAAFELLYSITLLLFTNMNKNNHKFNRLQHML